MANIVGLIIWRILLYGYGLFSYFLYLGLAVKGGAFFRRPTEQEKNEFQLGNEKPPPAVSEVTAHRSQLETHTGTFLVPPLSSITASTSFGLAYSCITSPTLQLQVLPLIKATPS